MPEFSLLHMTDAELLPLVRQTLSQINNVVWLAGCPLAWSAAAEAAVVPDDLPLNPIDRGRALRRAIGWAVDDQAPGPLPAGESTWRDPRWWRYHLLRHGYIDPIDPVDPSRTIGLTDALMARACIPDRDRLHAVQYRALRHVIRFFRLAEEGALPLATRTAAALAELCAPLRRQPHACRLLGLAATFRVPVPRRDLLEMAREENIQHTEQHLMLLLEHTLVIGDDNAREIRVPGKLRRWLAAKPSDEQELSWHAQAAAWHRNRQCPAEAIWHLFHARQYSAMLNALSRDFVRLTEQQKSAIAQLVSRIPAGQLTGAEQQNLQIIRGIAGLHARGRMGIEANLPSHPETGAPAAAYEAFLRLAAEYAKLNIPKAFEYYRQAAALAPPGGPQWQAAVLGQAGLFAATGQADEVERCVATVMDSLDGQSPHLTAATRLLLAQATALRGQFTRAHQLATESLSLWELEGNRFYQGECLALLSEACAATGGLERALYLADRSLDRFLAAGSSTGIARGWRNLAAVCLANGQPERALTHLNNAVAAAGEAGHQVEQYFNRYLSALALAKLNRANEARQNWRSAWDTARQLEAPALLAALRTLRTDTPALAGIEIPEELAGLEQAALDIACREGIITVQTLADRVCVSLATARRALCRLCAQKLLDRCGQGRSTRYLPGKRTGVEAMRPPQLLDATGQRTMALLDRKGHLTLRDMIDTLSLSRATAQRILAKLTAQGLLSPYGRGRSVKYLPTSTNIE